MTPKGGSRNVLDGVRTLQDLVRRIGERDEAAGLIAFREEGRSELSRRELVDRALRLAGGLRARGVQANEPVAIFAPNGPEWVQARLALMAVGAAAVSLDNDLDDAPLARQIEHSGARRAFASAAHAEALEKAGVTGDETYLLDVGDDHPQCWTRLLAAPPAFDELPPVAPEDTATLFYTSGTTGTPKAVPLTHANILSNVDALLRQDIVQPGDRVLLPLPLYHSYPFIVGMLCPLAAGATMVLPAGVTGPQIVRALNEAEVGIMIGVPRLYQALADGIEARLKGRGAVVGPVLGGLLRLSGTLDRTFGARLGRTLLAPVHRQLAPRLRVLASGGAKLDPAVAWRLRALGWEVLSGYGLVETSSMATFNPPGRARIGTAGLPAPGVEVKIDRPNAEGHGEVLVRGPNVFEGYRDNPEANAEAFTGDGWFRTGDLGTVDADGYLSIVGRVKEMIVLPGGKNVYPEDVEAVYAESRYVREIAVMERGGALVGLVVPEAEALREAYSSRVEDLIRVSLGELSHRLPAYKRLADWRLVREPLPRTHLGKYQRHKLDDIYDRAARGERAAAAEPSEEDRALLEKPRARRVWAFLQDRFPEHELSLDISPQLDLGVDSLAWVSLGMELEQRLGIALSEQAIARSFTLRDLLQAVEEAPEAAAPERDVEAETQRWLAPPPASLQPLGVLIHVLVRLLARLLFRLRVEGRERVPAEGPLIIASNHVSDLDAFVLAAALDYRQIRNVYWGADAERLFNTAPRRLLARIAHLFPVDDRTPGATMTMAREVLARGNVLAWFPEEWRSPDGTLQPFMPGVGLLLAETGAEVVPAVIDGTFEAMPRNRRLPRPHPVRIRFGEPIAAGTLGTLAPDDRRAHAAIAEALRERLADLGAPVAEPPKAA